MIARLAPVIAHRGASVDAAENSIDALRRAAAQGARCVEIDVQISGDGVPFLHHDERLGRTVAGDERLCELSAAELMRRHLLDGDGRATEESVPTLAEALDTVLRLDLVLNLEIKPVDGLEAPTTEAICTLLRSCWPPSGRIVLSSFDETVLDAARYWSPDLPRALITGAIPDDATSRLERLGCRNLHMAADAFDAGSADALRHHGYGLYCYTVNEIDRAQALFDAGVDGVFTDVPAQLLPLLGERR